MKLRIARKVCKALTPYGDTPHKDETLGRAFRRYQKTASAKAENRLWFELTTAYRRLKEGGKL